jgi:hypothetical protein
VIATEKGGPVSNPIEVVLQFEQAINSHDGDFWFGARNVFERRKTAARELLENSGCVPGGQQE